ncbi:MAG: hypothetical protein KJO00_06930, partial [Bacteroidia bacterium]|nr:hypothetical protein [Bacteroidia bacterium]
LKMSRFKLETKELLTYLVFESENEQAYVESVKAFITHEIGSIEYKKYYYIKKSIRRILRQTKRYIRYSKIKESEAEILIHFCSEVLKIKPSISKNKMLTNMYRKQLEMAQKAILKLHDDLQFDFNSTIDDLPRL